MFPDLLVDSCANWIVYFLPSLFTSWRIDQFSFQAGGRKRRPNLAYFLFILCYSIFCYGCMFFFVVLDLVFLGWEIGWKERLRNDLFCVGMWRKTLAQSIAQARESYRLSIHLSSSLGTQVVTPLSDACPRCSTRTRECAESSSVRSLVCWNAVPRSAQRSCVPMRLADNRRTHTNYIHRPTALRPSLSPFRLHRCSTIFARNDNNLH